jgi:hypothetical protein
MVFAAANIIDPFTRADGSLGSSWTQIPFGGSTPPEIISNAVGPTATSNFSVMYWNNTTFGIQTEAFIDIVTKYTFDDYDDMGVHLVQVASPMDSYAVLAAILSTGDLLKVVRYDDDIATTLGATVAQEITNGDAVGIRRVGSDIQLWYRTGGIWSLKATRTDTTYLGPYYPAFYASDGNAGLTYRYDNFGARNLPVVYDSFDRANENPIASPWLLQTGATGGMKIVSNVLQPSAIGGGGCASAYNTIITDDHSSEVIITTLNAGGQARACVRMLTTEQTMYFALVGGPFSGTTACVLAKYVNGAYTEIGTGSTASVQAGCRLACKCQGNKIKMIVNDVEIYSVTDYSISRGKAGAGAFATTLVTEVELASWEAEYAADGMSRTAGGVGGFGTDYPKFLLRPPPLAQGRGK